MMAVTVLLVALGLADLVSGGLSGTPKNPRRAAAGILVGCVLGGAWAWSASTETTRSFLWAAFVVAACCGWLLPRLGDRFPVWRARLALATLGVAVGIGVFYGGHAPGLPPGLAHIAPSSSSFPLILSHAPESLAFGGAILLFLSATSNGVVRVVLALAGTKVTSAEKRLRGGRYIGVIERFLIFGLAVAGQATAAALVVSAKSILRFPELSRRVGEEREMEGDQAAVDGREPEVVADVDLITEYFLLGSLTSWLLALAPVALFH